MNKEQVLSLTRNALSIAVGYYVGKGVLTAEQAATIVNDAMIAGPALIGLGTLIWGLISHTRASQIKAVAAMPEVAKVVIPDKVNGPIGAMAQTETLPKVVTVSQNTTDEKDKPK